MAYREHCTLQISRDRICLVHYRGGKPPGNITAHELTEAEFRTLENHQKPVHLSLLSLASGARKPLDDGTSDPREMGTVDGDTPSVPWIVDLMKHWRLDINKKYECFGIDLPDELDPLILKRTEPSSA